MKRAIAITLPIMMLFSVASADALEYMGLFNDWASFYGVPELTKDMIISDKPNMMVFMDDDYFVSYGYVTGNTVNMASFESVPDALFLPRCATLAMSFCDNPKDIVTSYGFLLNAYFEVMKGEEKSSGLFCGLSFSLSREDDKFTFFVMK